MRFPVSLTRSLTTYLLRKKLAGETKYPLVLMLEPLHGCNLSCGGCGRIREYADTINRRLTVEQCVHALRECGAPVVSVCGGEPLIYPELPELIDAILARRKHIYLCTNGLLMEKKLPELRLSKRLFINVHLDGMDDSHDRQAGQKGVFAAAVRGIQAAKSAGLKVYTNTTIYAETDMHEIAVLFAYLEELKVDGMMISPAFGFQAVEKTGHGRPGQFSMSRWQIHEKFCGARQMLERYRLTASPIYLDFLCGRRELSCAAWANPTYNVRGWRGPCYMVGDAHYPTYREFISNTDWERTGPGNNPKCEHCLVHCGFEPSAVLSAGRQLRDVLQMAVWQMT
jgi:hopanoid biosynthesis associated radical SAM protein HpnH